jgi:molybdopterin-containing oxidoreductase family membrane subunit
MAAKEQVHDQHGPDAVMQRTPPVIAPGHTFNSVTDTISNVVLTRRTSIGWFFGFFIAFSLLMLLNMTIGKLLLEGIGIWGNNIRSAGRSTSSTSCGGSASATPAP